MGLSDASRERAKVMAAGLESTASNPVQLAALQKMARAAMAGLREEYAILGLDDDAMAWLAFNTAKLYATLSVIELREISSVIDHSMAVYGLAAGALAGVYRLPGEPEAVKPDGASAPPQTGQYL